MKLYPDVDCMTLEPMYSLHMSAMTDERLISKSDIAAQLAWRDTRINSLQAVVELLRLESIRVTDLYNATLVRDSALGKKITP